MNLYEKLKTLVEISNSETSNLQSIREVEKAILTSFDNYGTGVKQEQVVIFEMYSFLDEMISNLGIKEFNNSERLKNAYAKVIKLDPEIFFQKGAFTALRKLRSELWYTVENLEKAN